jgi:hypothetical protein
LTLVHWERSPVSNPSEKRAPDCDVLTLNVALGVELPAAS